MATRQLDKMRAIDLPGGFRLDEHGLEVQGDPTLAQYEAAGLFIDRVCRAGGWWKCDHVAYGETRPEWKQAIEESMPPATRRQYRYIGKAFPVSKRIDGVEFGHHAAVVHFEPELRERVLRTAAREDWSVRETVQAAKQLAKSATTIITGGAPEIYEVEVSVLVCLEAGTPGAAERAAWDAVKAILTAHGTPANVLKQQVIATRARPKVGADE